MSPDHAKPALWQPEPCPSWCTSRKLGHWDCVPVAERRHESKWVTIDRPRLSAVHTGRRWRVRRTGVRIEQHVQAENHYAPMVRVETELDDGSFPVRNGGDLCHPLIVTASEALELAEMIRQAACMAANEQLPR